MYRPELLAEPWYTTCSRQPQSAVPGLLQLSGLILQSLQDRSAQTHKLWITKCFEAFITRKIVERVWATLPLQQKWGFKHMKYIHHLPLYEWICYQWYMLYPIKAAISCFDNITLVVYSHGRAGSSPRSLNSGSKKKHNLLETHLCNIYLKVKGSRYIYCDLHAYTWNKTSTQDQRCTHTSLKLISVKYHNKNL